MLRDIADFLMIIFGNLMYLFSVGLFAYIFYVRDIPFEDTTNVLLIIVIFILIAKEMMKE